MEIVLPYVDLPQTGATKLEACSCLELRGLNLFNHDNVLVHKASSMKTWFANAVVEELECPAQRPNLYPTECL